MSEHLKPCVMFVFVSDVPDFFDVDLGLYLVKCLDVLCIMMSVVLCYRTY